MDVTVLAYHPPGEFAEDGSTIRIEIEDAVNDDDIDLAVFYRKAFGGRPMEFYICEACFLRSPLCAVKHGSAEVNAGNPPAGVGSTGSHESVKTCTTPQVEDG